MKLSDLVNVNLNKWYTVIWCNVKHCGSEVPTGCSEVLSVLDPKKKAGKQNFWSVKL